MIYFNDCTSMTNKEAADLIEAEKILIRGAPINSARHRCVIGVLGNYRLSDENGGSFSKADRIVSTHKTKRSVGYNLIVKNDEFLRNPIQMLLGKNVEEARCEYMTKLLRKTKEKAV